MLNALNERQSVIINLPVKDVFAYVCDFANLIDWTGCTIAVRKTSLGEMQVGSTIRNTIRFLGRWMDITFEIVEFEPARCLTLKSLSGISPCLFSYQFEPLGDGVTHVSLEMVLHITCGMLGLSEAALANVMRRQILHDLLTLKDLLEAGVVAERSKI